MPAAITSTSGRQWAHEHRTLSGVFSRIMVSSNAGWHPPDGWTTASYCVERGASIMRCHVKSAQVTPHMSDKPTTNNEAEGDVDLIVMGRFFPGCGQGVLVEVGAARPDYLSISKKFRAAGWRIIAIEPNPDFCELHQKLGHEILQYACSDRDQDDVDFFVVDSHGVEYANGNVSFESFSSLGIKGGYQSLKPNLDKRKIKVRVRRLDSILVAHAPDVTEIDIISIDVEGWELDVLRGLTASRYRPKVMIIENLFNEQGYHDHLRKIGYTLWKRLSPNDIYVRNDLISPIGRFFCDLMARVSLLFRRKDALTSIRKKD